MTKCRLTARKSIPRQWEIAVSVSDHGHLPMIPALDRDGRVPGVPGQFAGEAAGGDGEGGHDGLEFVAEFVHGEFDGGDDLAARSEDGHGNAADTGFEFPASDGDAGESGDGEGSAEPVG